MGGGGLICVLCHDMCTRVEVGLFVLCVMTCVHRWMCAVLLCALYCMYVVLLSCYVLGGGGLISVYR